MSSVAAAHEMRDLPTPCLLLDAGRMDRNIARLKDRLARFDVSLRPHLKTAKSVDIARRMMSTPQGPATVSTLQEAEQFAAAGVRDMLYAVGIAPSKLGRVTALRKQGVELSVILDSAEQAHALVAWRRDTGVTIPALVEINCDGNRAGVRPDDPLLIEIGRILHDGAELRGVMTHAGASYGSRSTEELVRAAEQERAAVVTCADALRFAGLPSPVVSVGSTPTAHFARDLTGVTEVRAGVYVFFDLVQVGIGVCSLDDIAVSVLATVIGHQPDKNQIIVDAGWTAMSRDRGTADQTVDQGYGLVCDAAGRPYDDLLLQHVNQEHGVLEMRTSGARCPDLPVGALVRILPNHACATATQHAQYHVVEEGKVTAIWPRIPAGW